MDMAKVRRGNLGEILKREFEGNRSRLARSLGREQSFVSELLNGKRSFGEKLARAIELKLGKPRLSLDHVALETASDKPIAELPQILRRNFDIAFFAGHGAAGDEPDDELPMHRKAMMEAYSSLPPMVRFQIRALVSTLAHVMSSSYQEYVTARQREVKVRHVKHAKEK